jgi:helicase
MVDQLSLLPEYLKETLTKENITGLRPVQEKALQAGLLKEKNFLICTPTASGKTLVAELAMHHNLKQKPQSIAVYVVPLKALANEKFNSFSKKYPQYRVTLTSGDMDSDDPYLADYDIIITTSEKLDSLIRHKAQWISRISCLVIDEIHLLNDSGRGPTLEILITVIKKLCPTTQLVALSATIGNPQELAQWLNAELIQDTWRPVVLKEGIHHDGHIEFFHTSENNK